MLKSAWRGVRARGWAGVLVVGLLALALASNVVMFAFADSLVFARDPFPDADRIVTFSGTAKSPERIDLATSAALLEGWRRQPDLVAAIGGMLTKTLFLTGDGGAEMVRAADVTLGFLEVLGAAPRWGRSFTTGDDRDPGAFAVIISEDLARRRFGNPVRAPGRTLQATAGKLVVVGVMDRSFAYPNASYHVWRALDPVGPLMRNFGGVGVVARIAKAVPLVNLDAVLAARAPIVGASAGLTTYEVRATPLFRPAATARKTMVYVLMGAAISLLLAACANVASLELAAAVRRARTYAVHLSLGASRWSLARAAALEGTLLVGSSLVVAIALAWILTALLAPNLPDSLRLASNNPIDLDRRAMLSMAVVAVAAWMIAALPAVVAASRSSLSTLMKLDDRSSAASRGAVWLRRALTASEVAFAVILIVGGLLYARSYQNLLAVEKGFDSRSLFSVTWTMPIDFPVTALRQRAVEYLRETTGVEAVTTSPPPPSTGDSPSQSKLEIDGQPPMNPPVFLARKLVDADYFSVIRLPLRQGRLPLPGDPTNSVVVPELFVRRFFANGQAVGRTFRRSPNEPWQTITGVVGDFRTERTRMPQPGDRDLYYYTLTASAPAFPPPPAGAPRPVDTGGGYRFLTLTVRTNGTIDDAILASRAREVDPTLRVTATSVDETYAKQSQDTRLASQIVGAFSVVAFLISMAGVFAVMAFLVAGRTREIGIRMALGADPVQIRRLVLASSARMVVLGAVIGVGFSVVASRWIESQLFGVSPTDPATYVVASVAVVLVALLATWHPARLAARIDPAITLRSE